MEGVEKVPHYKGEPVKFELIPESLTSPYIDFFPGQKEGMVRGMPGNFVFTPEYGRRGVKEIYNFQLREDDIWVNTFSKSGTTWTQEMVWLIANDCDVETARKKNIFERSPYIEGSFLTSPENLPPGIMEMCSINTLNKFPSPRVIKSHLPLYLLPPKLLDTCKVVYVARNPKDVIVSNFNHFKLFKFHDYVGTLDQFADYSMEGLIYYSPYFPTVLEAWSQRNHPNMLFIFFEEMKQNLEGVIRRVADFLGKTLSDDHVITLLNYLSFENLSKMEKESGALKAAVETGVMNDNGAFYRKGKTGNWKEHMSQELSIRVDEWIRRNIEGTDLKFTLELDENQD